ncbi:hypothetical protein EDD11_008627 [Mortierella claussenii]|nr:hypothetical protein EDD11_008627 [Mortierella claussenii]
MTKSMQIHLEGQTNDPKVQRLMFPWTDTQGPIINGKLIINHKEDLTLKALTLNFKAKISCNWTERQGNRTIYYSAKKPLLEKTWVFLEKSDSKLHMLRGNQTYTYDFQLALPVNLPNSVTAMSSGKIEYLFWANGKRSTFQMDWDTRQLIEIYQSLPPSHPHCIYPIQQAANFENALSYLVQLPRKAFHHGSPVPITVRLNPLPGMGARWHVKDMRIKIKEYIWFISPGKGMKYEKRTLVETTQGKGTWPAQAGPVERVISVNVPASNLLTTVDTECIKCTHKLKILFTMDINGSSKKLPADFDLYIPGPFPPGQGPVGAQVQTQMQAPIPQQQQQQHHQQQQQQQQQQHHPMQQHQATQQPPSTYPLMQPSVQQQQQQYPPLQPAVSQQQQSYPLMPIPAQQQTLVMSPTGHGQSSPFSPPMIPHHSQQLDYPVPPASTPPISGNAPGMAALTSHPYSQGYSTPIASHSYPVATSLQGYPTPVMPPMPSPTAISSYPLPPSPAQGYAQNISTTAPSPGMAHISMPEPSPTPASAQVSHPKTPVLSYQQQQQQQQHHIVSPPKVDSPNASIGGYTLPTAFHSVLQADDPTKVNVNFDETIKVDLEDIKVPSTPSTPSSGSRSKNPQQRNSVVISGNDGISSSAINADGVKKQYSVSEAHSFTALPTEPQAPHAIKEPGEDNGQFSYQPPPPSSSSSSISAAAAAAVVSQSPPAVSPTPSTPPSHANNPYAAAAAAAAVSSQQHDLSHQFSQMGFTSPSSAAAAPVAPMAVSPLSGTSSRPMITSPATSFTQPPSPLTRPTPPTHYSSATYPMSPVSSAASGTVAAASQQSYQSPSGAMFAVSTTVPPMSQTMHQAQFQQHQQHQPQHQQNQQCTNHSQPIQSRPQKQQIWIPMYQTLAGKTYVQYHLAA